MDETELPASQPPSLPARADQPSLNTETGPKSCGGFAASQTQIRGGVVIKVLAIIVAASATALGFSIWGSTMDTVEAKVEVPSDWTPRFVSAKVMGQLAEDKPLRLRLGQEMDFVPGTKTNYMYVTQLYYPGEINEQAVRAVIQQGKAQALEHRLTRAHSERLAKRTLGIDTTIRDVSLLIEDEQEQIRDSLRKRSDRRIVMSSTPAAGAPEFPLLKKAMKQMGRKGALWPEAYRGGELYLMVYWSEWPSLRTLLKDRDYVLKEREGKVRDWIVIEYGIYGMGLFTE